MYFKFSWGGIKREIPQLRLPPPIRYSCCPPNPNPNSKPFLRGKIDVNAFTELVFKVTMSSELGGETIAFSR